MVAEMSEFLNDWSQSNTSRQIAWLHDRIIRLYENQKKIVDALKKAEGEPTKGPPTGEGGPSETAKTSKLFEERPKYIPEAPQTKRAYLEHYAYLKGKIPSEQELMALHRKLLPGRRYNNKIAAIPWVCSERAAKAYFFFLSHLGLVVFNSEQRGWNKLTVQSSDEE